ncbi:MAG: hypothetical protein LBP89_02040 [Helicobacteraceae bacterium]|jgi:hypothetical protein|nr:hypothetical protein [Helicobacteraceae bacterium]
MQLKRYSIFSAILLVALGVFVYIHTDGADQAIKIGDDTVTLPLAVWAMFPALVLFLTSFSHIAFYSAAAYFGRSSLEKDLKTLKRLIINALLGQTSVLTLKHPQLAAIGRILSDAQLKPLAHGEKCGDSELDAILDVIASVSKGETADFGSIKLAKDSPIWIAVQLNKMKSNPKISEELLSASVEGSEVYFKALEVYATYGDKKRFLRSEAKINVKSVLNLLSRHKAPIQSLDFEENEIVDLIGKANFNAKDFIDLARIMKEQLAPDSLLALFAQLKNSFEAAQSAWLYINVELERQDETREILDSSANDEYLTFKSYFALKEAGLSPNLDSLIDRAL